MNVHADVFGAHIEITTNSTNSLTCMDMNMYLAHTIKMCHKFNKFLKMHVHVHVFGADIPSCHKLN